MDTISVIITTYKRELSLLLEAINSVKRQSVMPLEIIVVDDNGEGTEYQKINQSQFENDPFIKYIVNKKNCGAQISRNKGIKASGGTLIAFLDDDDYWDERKLEKQIKVLTDESVGMVFCQGWVFRDGYVEHKRTYPSSAKFVKEPSFLELLEKDYIGTTSQALIRKSCFDVVGTFDVDMPARQDYELWLRIAKEFRIVGVEEKLFYHRIHEAEQISKSYKKAIQGYKLILLKYKSEFQTRPEAKAYQFYKMGRICMGSKKYCEGIKYFSYAFMSAPKYILNNMFSKILQQYRIRK